MSKRREWPFELYEPLGRGRYRERASGRVYVDSRDMEDAIEKAQDASASKQDDEERRARELAKHAPPEHVVAQAQVHEHRLAQRTADAARRAHQAREVRGEVGLIRARLSAVEGGIKWRTSAGLAIDQETIEERDRLLGRLRALTGGTDHDDTGSQEADASRGDDPLGEDAQHEPGAE